MGKRRHLYRLGTLLTVTVVCAISGIALPTHAEVTSSGLNTSVNTTGGVSTITGGTRPGDGPNLFHSFGSFSVDVGETANFSNDSGLATSNILSRVTGGNPSQIYGTIQTTGFPGANLYLMNPAGILIVVRQNHWRS